MRISAVVFYEKGESDYSEQEATMFFNKSHLVIICSVKKKKMSIQYNDHIVPAKNANTENPMKPKR